MVDPDGRLNGLVTLRELAQTPPVERATTPVARVMLAAEQLAVVSPADSGHAALSRMVELGVNQLPVLSEGRLVGAVTREALLGVVRAHLVVADG